MTRYMGTTQYVRFDHFLYMLCNFFLVDDRLGGFLDGKRDLCQAYTTGRVEGGGCSWTVTGEGDKITLEWWDHTVFVGDMYYVVCGVLDVIRPF